MQLPNCPGQPETRAVRGMHSPGTPGVFNLGPDSGKSLFSCRGGSAELSWQQPLPVVPSRVPKLSVLDTSLGALSSK